MNNTACRVSVCVTFEKVMLLFCVICPHYARSDTKDTERS